LGAVSFRGAFELVKLLLESGANPNIRGEISMSTLSELHTKLIVGGEYGTALGAASVGGELDIIKLLLRRGADPNIQGENTVCTCSELYKTAEL
jgi:hypothetical protein